MKYYILLLAVVVNSFITNAQKILSDPSPNIGFYKSIDEMLNNSPSIPFTYDITQKNIKLNAFGPKTDVFRVDIDKSEVKSIGNIIGFSDGKDIYIRSLAPKSPWSFGKRKFKKNSDFLKVLDLGVYIYFESIAASSHFFYNGKPNSTMMTRYISKNVIDTKSGKSLELSKKNIKELIADEPDLLHEFNQDKDQKKNLNKYILKYNDLKRRKL